MSDPIKVYSQFAHPATMWILFGLTLYAMYTGLQWRKTRSAVGEEKKKLIAGKFKDTHHKIGALALSLMVLGTIAGMGVTYWNNGKLFVGPHLFVGLAMAGTIAVSASLTPYMQKGAEWARIMHISLNTVIVGLFGWQAFTGLDIVQRIISKMGAAA